MSLSFPYTYISCPCSDDSNRAWSSQRNSRDLSREGVIGEDEEEEKPFNPHHPRSNYSLFPPEYLLYCEECHDLKCPRCVTEEIVCWYCPSCLFETPSSMVRSEGNRCARNCFNCPVCTSQLTVNTLTDAKDGPWILNCNYCMWTSLDIGIKFDRPTNIRSQLDKIANGGRPKPSTKQSDSSDPSRKSSLAREPFSPSAIDDDNATPDLETTDPEPPPLDPAARFAALKSFYKTQITPSSTSDLTSASLTAGDIAYSSPATLARLLNIYSKHGNPISIKKPKDTRAPIMREALTPAEGLLVSPLQDASQTSTVTHLSDTASLAQKSFQLSASNSGNPHAHLVSDLRPMPALLRTKRAKRCAACKHILVRPEFKPTSTRYRMKLTALNYIPLVLVQPMFAKPTPAPAPAAAGSVPPGREVATTTWLLPPHQPHQWLLTLKNHLFDAVKVSLATPAVTPGKLGHRVTVLCPQFEIGANSEVWGDAALRASDKDKRMSVAVGGPSGDAGGFGEEAGKVYDKGRNWTSVVLEVVAVPAGSGGGGGGVHRSSKSTVEAPKIRVSVVESHQQGGVGRDKSELPEREEVDGEDEDNEDDDVVEIPIRVRLEWRQSDHFDEPGKEEGKKKTTTTAAGTKAVDAEGEMVDEAKRELAYWMVLGIARVGW